MKNVEKLQRVNLRNSYSYCLDPKITLDILYHLRVNVIGFSETNKRTNKL